MPRAAGGRRASGDEGRSAKEGKSQLEFVEPFRRRLAAEGIYTEHGEFSRSCRPRARMCARVSASEGGGRGGERGRGGGAGEGGHSVNFILPQLRAGQGERTSLAPRPRRPTFLCEPSSCHTAPLCERAPACAPANGTKSEGDNDTPRYRGSSRSGHTGAREAAIPRRWRGRAPIDGGGSLVALVSSWRACVRRALPKCRPAHERDGMNEKLEFARTVHADGLYPVFARNCVGPMRVEHKRRIGECMCPVDSAVSLRLYLG